MKHLIKYKIFESSEDCLEIKKTCEDILLELQDDGFEIDVRMGLNPSKNEWDYPDFINITLTKINKFEEIDIQEYLLRIADYLKEFNMIVDDDCYSCPSLNTNDIYNHIVKQWSDPDYWKFEIFFRHQN